MSDEGIKVLIREQYKLIGRKPLMLHLEKRNTEELKSILEKLKGMKYALDLLFSPNPGNELATSVLKELFTDGK